MLAKKSRTHSCGLSNIDFRSLNDESSLKKFQPWKIRKNFGTMGSSDFHLKIKELKDLMKPTEKLNTIYDKKHETPNPKFYSTALFYNLQRLPVKPETLHISDKIGELDESFKGKEKYTGDSMMIAQITKIRKKHTSMNKREKDHKGIKQFI